MYGNIVCIRKNGQTGRVIPLTSINVLLGSSKDCTIRIEDIGVAEHHCQIITDNGKSATLRNLCEENPTLVNGNQIGSEEFELSDKDAITIVGRKFEWRYPVSLVDESEINMTEMLSSLKMKRKSEPILNPKVVTSTPQSKPKSVIKNKRKTIIGVGSAMEVTNKSVKKKPVDKRVHALKTAALGSPRRSIEMARAILISRRSTPRVKLSPSKGSTPKHMGGRKLLKTPNSEVRKSLKKTPVGSSSKAAASKVNTPVSSKKTPVSNKKSSQKTPKTSVKSPKTSVKSPKTSVKSPKTTVKSPKTAVKSPKTTVKSPKASVKSPKASVKSPKTAVKSPKTTVKSPKASVKSPKDSVKSPKTPKTKSKKSIGVVSALKSVKKTPGTPKLSVPSPKSGGKQKGKSPKSPSFKTSPLSVRKPLRKSSLPKLTKVLSQSLEGKQEKKTPKPKTPAVKKSTPTSGKSTTKKSVSKTPKVQKVKESTKKSASSEKRKLELTGSTKKERPIKKLKLDPPKSPDKKKMAALLVCHGKSILPKSGMKRMLYSDILKKKRALMALKKAKSSAKKIKMPVVKKQGAIKYNMELPKSLKFTNRHANSPDPIVIGRKTPKTPRAEGKKGQAGTKLQQTQKGTDKSKSPGKTVETNNQRRSRVSTVLPSSKPKATPKAQESSTFRNKRSTLSALDTPVESEVRSVGIDVRTFYGRVNCAEGEDILNALDLARKSDVQSKASKRHSRRLRSLGNIPLYHFTMRKTVSEKKVSVQKLQVEEHFHSEETLSPIHDILSNADGSAVKSSLLSPEIKKSVSFLNHNNFGLLGTSQTLQSSSKKIGLNFKLENGRSSRRSFSSSPLKLPKPILKFTNRAQSFDTLNAGSEVLLPEMTKNTPSSSVSTVQSLKGERRSVKETPTRAVNAFATPSLESAQKLRRTPNRVMSSGSDKTPRSVGLLSRQSTPYPKIFGNTPNSLQNCSANISIDSNATNFDFDGVKSLDITTDLFVSPLDSSRKSRTSSQDSVNVSRINETVTSPVIEGRKTRQSVLSESTGNNENINNSYKTRNSSQKVSTEKSKGAVTPQSNKKLSFESESRSTPLHISNSSIGIDSPTSIVSTEVNLVSTPKSLKKSNSLSLGTSESAEGSKRKLRSDPSFNISGVEELVSSPKSSRKSVQHEQSVISGVVELFRSPESSQKKKLSKDEELNPSVNSVSPNISGVAELFDDCNSPKKEKRKSTRLSKSLENLENTTCSTKIEFEDVLTLNLSLQDFIHLEENTETLQSPELSKSKRSISLDVELNRTGNRKSSIIAKKSVSPIKSQSARKSHSPNTSVNSTSSKNETPGMSRRSRSSINIIGELNKNRWCIKTPLHTSMPVDIEKSQLEKSSSDKVNKRKSYRKTETTLLVQESTTNNIEQTSSGEKDGVIPQRPRKSKQEKGLHKNDGPTPTSIFHSGVKRFFRVSPTGGNVSGIKKLFANAEEKNSYLDVHGVKKLFQEEKAAGPSPRLIGVKELFQLEKTRSPRLAGMKELFQLEKTRSPRLAGVKELFQLEKTRSPRLAGVKELFHLKTTRSPRLAGVKELFQTGKVARSPRLSGLKELFQTRKASRSPRQIKELFRTEKKSQSPKSVDVKELEEGKVSSSPILSGKKEICASPNLELSNEEKRMSKKGETPKEEVLKRVLRGHTEEMPHPLVGKSPVSGESVTKKPGSGIKGRSKQIASESDVPDMKSRSPLRDGGEIQDSPAIGLSESLDSSKRILQGQITEETLHLEEKSPTAVKRKYSQNKSVILETEKSPSKEETTKKKHDSETKGTRKQKASESDVSVVPEIQNGSPLRQKVDDIPDSADSGSTESPVFVKRVLRGHTEVSTPVLAKKRKISQSPVAEKSPIKEQTMANKPKTGVKGRRKQKTSESDLSVETKSQSRSPLRHKVDDTPENAATTSAESEDIPKRVLRGHTEELPPVLVKKRTISQSSVVQKSPIKEETVAKKPESGNRGKRKQTVLESSDEVVEGEAPKRTLRGHKGEVLTSDRSPNRKTRSNSSELLKVKESESSSTDNKPGPRRGRKPKTETRASPLQLVETGKSSLQGKEEASTSTQRLKSLRSLATNVPDEKTSLIKKRLTSMTDETPNDQIKQKKTITLRGRKKEIKTSSKSETKIKKEEVSLSLEWSSNGEVSEEEAVPARVTRGKALAETKRGPIRPKKTCTVKFVEEVKVSGEEENGRVTSTPVKQKIRTRNQVGTPEISMITSEKEWDDSQLRISSHQKTETAGRKKNVKIVPETESNSVEGATVNMQQLVRKTRRGKLLLTDNNLTPRESPSRASEDQKAEDLPKVAARPKLLKTNVFNTSNENSYETGVTSEEEIVSPKRRGRPKKTANKRLRTGNGSTDGSAAEENSSSNKKVEPKTVRVKRVTSPVAQRKTRSATQKHT